MWRRTAWLCLGTSVSQASAQGSKAAPAAAATRPNSGNASSAHDDFDERVQHFCQHMKAQQAIFDGVVVCPTPAQSRGLVARCAFRENTTVLSVPMHHLVLSAPVLAAQYRNDHRAKREGNYHNNNNEDEPTARPPPPPSLDVVCRVMSARSVRDPVLYDQVYLALLLAAERVNPRSIYRPYLDLLPHPAIDDAAVVARYKDVIDPSWLIEWDDHQREFLGVLHALRRRWDPTHHDEPLAHHTAKGGSEATTTIAAQTSEASSLVPPIEVMYWALRTVLSRMHLLPAEGHTPAELGSSLPYDALHTLEQAEQQTRLWPRLRATVRTMLGSPVMSSEAPGRLVPSLVPLLDMATHLSSSNVRVEVTQRAGAGACVELQAIREIEANEPIGIRFNTTHSPAFLLYRFGFIPQ